MNPESSLTFHASRFTPSRPPQFREDYDIGYIFFVDESTVVADGIAWFERWDRNGAPRIAGQKPAPVIHTGVCCNENECYEAHWETGVALGDLRNYFGGPIYFRRPRGWNPGLGISIASAAAYQLGRKYNKPLIAAQLLANTFLGHVINKLCRNWVNDKVSAWLDEKGKFICSELSAYALAQQPCYKGVGVLSRPLDTISPQMLFDDPQLWETA